MPVATGFSADHPALSLTRNPGFGAQQAENPVWEGFIGPDHAIKPPESGEAGAKPLPLSGKPGVFGVRPILQIKVGVGRPRQLPTTKAITRPNGRVVWRVLATINGKQRKKICATQGEAELVAHQWATAQTCDLQVLPTRLSPTQLREAEAVILMLENIGLSLRDAANWVLKNYQRPSAVKWAKTIADYESDRAKQGISHSQIGNVAKAAKRLAGFLGRPELGDLTQTEIESFLETLPDDSSHSTFNGLLGDVRTFCRWCVGKKHLVQDPTSNIERRRIKRGLPEILRPDQAEALVRDVEKHHPAWVPYLCLCLFGAMRPGLREGEASRLNTALRKKQNVIHDGGFEVSGKANGIRIVPWSLAGPLKEWLTAYPPEKGLWPCDSNTIAEREWAKIRKRHSLSADVLRHTGITAMAYAPEMSLAQVAIAAGNSETMIRKHYLGRWTKEETIRLWAIKPLRVPATVS